MSADIELIQGPLTGSIRDDFYSLPAQIYPQHSPRLQQTEGINETYFVTALLAHRQGAVLARCCLYDNPHILHDEEPALLIGNFECRDNFEACTALIEAAEKTAFDLGKRLLIGPMNGSTWDTYRFAVEPQATAFLTEPIHMPYYAAFFERAGFNAIHHYQSWSAKLHAGEAALATYDVMMKEAGISIRPISKASLQTDLQQLYPLCQRAFSEAPFYSPISEEEFLSRYLPFAVLLKPGYAWLAEDEKGNPVAFLLGFPDAYDSSRAILKTVAKEPSCNVKGLATALILRFMDAAFQDGRTEALHAFIHQGNVSSQSRSVALGGKPWREYRLYAKRIGR